MAQISIDGANLVIEIEGLDKLWALKSRLEIPLAKVRGATIDPGVTRKSRGIRAAGAYFPGILTAGTFHTDGEQVFWDVRDPTKAVVIQLADERYTRLIIEVPDPRTTVTQIEHAIVR